MKRLLSLILALLCISTLFACDTENSNTQKKRRSERDVGKMCEHNWEQAENFNEYTAVDQCSLCGATRMYTDPDSICYSGDEKDVKLLMYNWDGYGISEKEIYNCDIGYAIIECLSSLQSTGESVPKISDTSLDDFAYDLPVARGTMWIDCGGLGLFRFDPTTSEICKVDDYFGEGVLYQMTDTLGYLLNQAWYYYPRDFWSGSYEDGSTTLNQLYKSDSAVEWIEIEDIYIENKIDSKDNKISLRIRASESKTVTAVILSYQSDDNLGSDASQVIELVAGKESTLEFTFFGFYDYPYYVSITIDNSVIDLRIDPRD